MESKIAEHIPRLRRYARTLTGDRELADDLVQDCLERALKRKGYWQPGSNLRTWLFTILHNLFVNRVRHWTHHSHFVELEEHHGYQPATTNEQALNRRDLLHALGRLPFEQREVLSLVVLEGLSYREVAAIMDIPQGTVMSRLARARERLRQLLDQGETAYLRRVK